MASLHAGGTVRVGERRKEKEKQKKEKGKRKEKGSKRMRRKGVTMTAPHAAFRRAQVFSLGD